MTSKSYSISLARYDGKEIIPSIFGVGALAIGKLKNKTEAKLIRMAAEAPKGARASQHAEAVDRNRKLGSSGPACVDVSAVMITQPICGKAARARNMLKARLRSTGWPNSCSF